MKGFKTFLVVMVFICLVVGFVLAFGGKLFVSKKKNTEQVAERKALRLKLIGYVVLLLALAFAIFQSMINV